MALNEHGAHSAKRIENLRVFFHIFPGKRCGQSSVHWPDAGGNHVPSVGKPHVLQRKQLDHDIAFSKLILNQPQLKFIIFRCIDQFPVR